MLRESFSRLGFYLQPDFLKNINLKFDSNLFFYNEVPFLASAKKIIRETQNDKGFLSFDENDISQKLNSEIARLDELIKQNEETRKRYKEKYTKASESEKENQIYKQKAKEIREYAENLKNEKKISKNS